VLLQRVTICASTSKIGRFVDVEASIFCPFFQRVVRLDRRRTGEKSSVRGNKTENREAKIENPRSKQMDGIGFIFAPPSHFFEQ